MHDDDRPALRRAHLAKRAGNGKAGLVDGGAVSVGLSVGVLSLVVVTVLPLSSWYRIGVVAVALFVGAFLAGSLAGAARLGGAGHGVLVACCLDLLMAAFSLTLTIGNGTPSVIPLAHVAGDGGLSLLVVLSASLVLGAGGGQFGAARRRRVNA